MLPCSLELISLAYHSWYNVFFSQQTASTGLSAAKTMSRTAFSTFFVYFPNQNHQSFLISFEDG
jgi:hypothetical protein